MTLWPRLLPPRTLSSRLIVMAAATLLVGQLFGFALLVREHQRQASTMSAAPATFRIVDFLASASRESRFVGQSVKWSAARPHLSGKAEPELARRAGEMLANAGVQVRFVAAAVDHGHVPPLFRFDGPKPPLASGGASAAPPPPPPPWEGQPSRLRLQLAVQLRDGRWLLALAPLRHGPSPLVRPLLIQTFAAYLVLLVPLLWFGRRLSAPLRQLTLAARDYSPERPVLPLPERGASDIADLTQAFNALQARIAAMLAEKDHMLGAIGHDLRTPLASLRVRIESVPDVDERAQMTATIEYMHHMLEDILALARVGRERQPPQRTDISALAEAVVDDHAALGGDVTLVEAERAIVDVHVPAVRRAIANLIDNGVKYGLRARVSTRIEGSRAIVRVEDDGPGIDPARLPEMLEPFTRIEESRNRETGGTGLGLALVKAVMRSEGGTVRLVNRAGNKGLIAELDFPLAG